MISRLLVTAVVLAVVATVTARSALAQTPKRGGVFRVPAPDAPALDPHANPFFLTQTYASLVYSHVVRFPREARAEGLERQPHPAGSRREVGMDEPDHDGLHPAERRALPQEAAGEGREVTADDVKYSLERFRAKSPIRVRFDPVQTIEVVDRHTVRITLREPYAPFMNHLANPTACAILPREAEEKLGDFNHPDAVIGTGPFVLKSYQKGVRAVFERNPDYYMAGLPYLDGVTIEIVPDAAARLSLAALGQARVRPLVGMVESGGRARPEANQSRDGDHHPDGGRPGPHLHAHRPAAFQRRARAARHLARHRPQGGAGGIALRRRLPQLSAGPLRDDRVEAGRRDPRPGPPEVSRRHDPAEAKRLLAEAGFPRGFTTPVFHSPGFAPTWRSYFDLTAESLGKIGVSAELRPEEVGKYVSTTSLGKFEKMAMGPYGAGVTEVDEFLYELFATGSDATGATWTTPS
jgi:peptide/nickel transport system substrate-binding protein